MHRFGFIIHPLSIDDVARKYSVTRYLPDAWVESLLRHMKPQLVSEITGVKSATGAETAGWFVGCPLTSEQLLHGDPVHNTEVIIQCALLAQEAGADLVGLGALTSCVGDAGITIADRVKIGVTTGNSYTVATAVEGALQAARRVGTELRTARVTVLGATGAIGRVCARLLLPQVGALTLVARQATTLEELAEQLRETNSSVVIDTSTDINSALRDADIVIAVTASVDALIQPEMLKPGAVVCDVARPRDVSRRVAAQRQDVLVIEGGAVAVPGPVQFNCSFGFPPGLAYACMAETMILGLEGRVGDYSLGRDLRLEQVEEIAGLAARHGFALAGFRSFERAVSEQQIEQVRKARAAGERHSPSGV